MKGSRLLLLFLWFCIFSAVAKERRLYQGVLLNMEHVFRWSRSTIRPTYIFKTALWRFISYEAFVLFLFT